MKKQYIEVPLPMECGTVRKTCQYLIGFFLLPWYLIAAQCLGAPGVALHFKCAYLAVRILISGRIPLRKCCSLIFFPMDSTRYFEFHEVLKKLSCVPFRKYLDVSSPCAIPLMLLMKNRAAVANMINPDNSDIEETGRLVAALALRDRCTLTNCTIEKTNFTPESFDLITCVSVLEHIPDDGVALRIMWSLLSPGGRLILTLPCMAQPMEQYISHNQYGVLFPGADGYTFWQRYYDEESLHETIFNITGLPSKVVVYGERRRGFFFRNASMKRLMGPLYPFWRESYMMAREYRYFQTISELPGEGVVMLEFIKP